MKQLREKTMAENKRDISITIRNLRPEDIVEVKKLCEMVHWPLTLQDIRRLYELEPLGWFCAEADNQYIGQAMGMVMGSLGCIAMVVVRDDYRRKGVGTVLTAEALTYLRNKCIKTIRLDSTPEGYNIYKKLGFADEFPVYHYVTKVASTNKQWARIPEVKPMVVTDLEAAVEFDRRSFGDNRARVLKALFNDAKAFVIKRGSEIQGYVMYRDPGTRLCWLGPLVANEVLVAEKLLRRVLAELSGKEIRLGVPTANPKATALFEGLGFEKEFEIMRMVYGSKLEGENISFIFAEAGHEKS